MEVVHAIGVRLVADVFVDYLSCWAIGGGDYGKASGAEVFGPVLGCVSEIVGFGGSIEAIYERARAR